MDFGFSLGVLHHTINTLENLIICTNKLKKGSPFLIYLYYRFDNKPKIYFYVWKISNLLRLIISKLPFLYKNNYFINCAINLSSFCKIFKIIKYI